MKETLLSLKPKLLDDKLLLGWQEWCVLPGLGLPLIKAKIDTGAKTSALHAFNIEPHQHQGKTYVHFSIHPLQRDRDIEMTCKARVIDQREVMSSNGHKEERYVIRTPLLLGHRMWDIDITLSNRDPLKFRMLLGREALNNHVVVEPSHRLLQGRVSHKKQRQIYEQNNLKQLLDEAVETMKSL